MRSMKTGIVSGLMGLVLASAASASTTSARIANILIYDGGNMVYVYPAGGILNAPGCHGANGNYYSFSMSRPLAREYLAGLLAAQAQGATVSFYGTNTCADQSVSETLAYFSISSP